MVLLGVASVSICGCDNTSGSTRAGPPTGATPSPTGAATPSLSTPLLSTSGPAAGMYLSDYDCLKHRLPPNPTYCTVERWLRGLAQKAGYRVVGNTGSAWLVANDPRVQQGHFYLSVTDAFDAKQFPDLGAQKTVEGVVVYGSRRRVWQTQGLSFWVEPAGPYKTIPPPPDADTVALDALGRLIEATVTTPRPLPGRRLGSGH